MATKARVKKMATGNEYRVLAGRKQVTITARNIKEAGMKARRLFPKANLISVSRKPSRSGTEYETYWISR